MTYFGVVAYDLGLVTMKQLVQALDAQKRARTTDVGLQLGEVFRRLGHLSPAQVDEVLVQQRYLHYPLKVRLQIALEQPATGGYPRPSSA